MNAKDPGDLQKTPELLVFHNKLLNEVERASILSARLNAANCRLMDDEVAEVTTGQPTPGAPVQGALGRLHEITAELSLYLDRIEHQCDRLDAVV